MIGVLAHGGAPVDGPAGASALAALLVLLVLGGAAVTYVLGSAAGPGPPEAPRAEAARALVSPLALRSGAGPRRPTEQMWLPRGREHDQGAGSGRAAPARWVAPACALAGLLHVVALGQHLRADPVHGLFFAALVVLQLGLALRLRRSPTDRAVRLVVASSAWVTLLWSLSRTTGIAMVTGPEPFGLLDVVVSAVQVLIAAACLRSLRPGAG